MNKKLIITEFWKSVIEQNDQHLKTFFLDNARIRWHNTNELFSLEEYIIANCEYPGNWKGEVERIEELDSMVVTVTRLVLAEDGTSFHATSFFEFDGDKIISLDEYWGEDGAAPQWRIDKKIGKVIK